MQMYSLKRVQAARDYVCGPGTIQRSGADTQEMSGAAEGARSRQRLRPVEDVRTT